ncbi:MAG: hypothetical protein ACXADY_13090 [Candidatus Hodarchaeales archaeon]|jgi:hypothetical protein
MQERKFTDKEVYLRTAIASVIMFIVFTILMNIIIGLVAAAVTFLTGVIMGKKVMVEK